LGSRRLRPTALSFPGSPDGGSRPGNAPWGAAAGARFRIELGEIEQALAEHPELQAATVVLRNDSPLDQRLLAYVVPRTRPAPAGLLSRVRSFLEQKLPGHMIPSSITQLDELPLTQNGKVDRAALPAPDRARPRLGAEYVAPRTFIEEELSAIFAAVLGIELVGVHDNFFELGGHSLLVLRVIFSVREIFHIELPMRALFEAPTIAGLARHIETLQPGRGGLSVPAVMPVRREGRLPLSFGQQRLWFLGQLLPDAPSYNEPVTIRFRGAVNATALEAAIDEILRRHEAWRTTFQAIDGEPFQVIHPHTPLQLQTIDLRSLPPEVREKEYLALCTSEAHRPFSLVEGPLVRFLLLLIADDDARLFMTFHHVIADGLSIYSVFSVELAQLYRAYTTDQPSPLPELPIQYADFALWQRKWLRSEVIERQLAYWQKHLGPQPPRLQLPVDHAAPLEPAFRGARELLALPLGLTQRLRRLGHQEGATLFITLLAALKGLFHRYIEQQDVVVGIVAAGRQRPELAPLLGFFPNTLVLRTEMTGDPSFRVLLRRVRETTLQAFDNQDVPFERVVEALNPQRRPGEMPLFRAGFILDPLTPDLGNEWTITSTEVEISAAKFDLCLELVEVPQGVVGRISYRTELFEPATIQRMALHYVTLLTNAAEDPELPLSRLELLSLDERAQLARWGKPRAAFPTAQGVHELFAAQVARSPDAPALRLHPAGETLSYRELDERANRVAHALRARGVGPEVIVALGTQRSSLLIVGMLGILKAGGAFLALDPAYPRDRLAFMLADAGVELLLTDSTLKGQLPEPRGETLLLDDQDWQRAGAKTAPDSGATAANLAYVIYTSGSTGRPKGVLIEHRSLGNSILAHIDELGIGPRECILQFASPSFDVAVCEIMMALLSGATLLLAPREALLPGPELVALLAAHKVTLLAITPSTLTVLPAAPLPELRTLIIGGEPLPLELVARWGGGTTSRRLYNAYGPTEGTICATLAHCWLNDGPPAIGRPLKNTQIYVLDAHLQLVPVGITGEIFIGGAGLARGYLGRPELTAEKFIKDPFTDDPQARLYRTGDLGRWRPDGQLEFVGRGDNQVKIRGFRIELGEIEAVLSALPGVREAVVIARTDRNERLLIAYIVPDEPAPSVVTLRAELAETLPQYMVPMAIVPLPALPRTPNGKTDRQALAQSLLRLTPAAEVEYRPPEGDLEQALATVWQEVLGVERVGMNDNFFDLGGHSLRMAQVQARLREVLKREIPLLTLFQYPTIRTLAAFLQGDQETDKLSSSQERGRKRKEAAAQQRRRVTEKKKRDE
jgi:amino acid adenylation domain-containing protein